MKIAERQKRMRLAALASEECLAGFLLSFSLPTYRVVRGPETGLVMAKGRVGNTGDVFNIGEVLVTRCAVAFENGITGFSWIAGEKPRHAEMAALCDALWQDKRYADTLDADLLPKLEGFLSARNQRTAQDVAATRVNFFTFVRGEDA